MSIFEAGMMLCFGVSWPFQVAKTYKTKNVKGKSILFLWFVEVGYLMGMAHKVFYNMDAVIYLYALNFLLVGTDMMLYYLYKNKPENNAAVVLLEKQICEKSLLEQKPEQLSQNCEIK